MYVQDLREQEDAVVSLRAELEKAKRESAEKGSVRVSSLPFLSFPMSLSTHADDVFCQAELQAEVENLRRENRLMTSAWYDMAARLQSNTVVLQRKSEAPKSWLGKQRALVGVQGRVGR